MVASDEYASQVQSPRQQEVQARLMDMGAELSRHQGLSRRRFFQTSAGMAAAFVALNDVYGPVFSASRAEAATPDMAQERSTALRGQFIMDMHTHFLRDDTRLTGFVRMREAVGQRGWNPDLSGRPQTLEDLKFDNYIKEVFLDSDTKAALISSAPSDIPEDWFLTNSQMAKARERVNAEAGGRRLFTHAIFTPGAPGWLEALDAALELRPDSLKGYTVGDNTHKATSRYPWRMDDEAVAYKGYEKMAAAGRKIVCVHKGLFSAEVEAQFPHLAPFADVRDVGQAAKDWPDLTFVIYHSAYRLGDPAKALAQFEETGRLDWVSDLADIPERYGVTNVYADLGQVFAQTMVAEPRVCAALMGILIKGLGADHVCWGTDAVWTGSPQWQIEGLRRLEIPEDMRVRHGFAELGAADGSVKTAIFGGNNARLYQVDATEVSALENDGMAGRKAAYLAAGPRPSLRRYGYVRSASA
ncbi:amidohydrolase family protein [Phenylobacterium sp.]|uniref:amidohydrolase family protein n=1 Tax=Phenylobacterium sp. TaxID=1871053 RepID=UPI0027320D84|nr:amidohydrolase family protein [Phenylobacterium sp.]